MDALYQFGISLIQAIQNTFSPALDGFMSAVTFMGRIEFYLVLIPFIYWTIDRRIGVRILLILIYTDFVTNIFKTLLHQPRPYWIGDVKQMSVEPSYGIPSSHASDSIAVGGYLAAKIKKNWFWILIAVLVFLIGFSRLHLGMHFPHDVLVGWLIGLAVLWAVFKWEGLVRAWLDDKSISTQILLGFIDSLLIFLAGLLARFIISGTPDPASYSSYSADARSITHFFSLAGAAFGTYAGYALMRRYANFDTKGMWGVRLARYIVGVLTLLVAFYGLDKLFAAITPDETTLGYALRYIRYGFATFWAFFLAPWLFIKTKLAGTED